MAETVDDAIYGERRNIRVRIFQKRKAGFRRADFRDGGSKPA
jgi:hypothetical protein